LDIAEQDGTLSYVGSTYSHENDQVYEGISRNGLRLVTFAPVLKSKLLPLPEILELLLDMGTWGMGTPVEMEFAVNMNVPQGKPKEFGVLQMRPLVVSREFEELNLDSIDQSTLICQSSQVLGNGKISNIYDVIVVDFDKFERAKSQDVAREVGQFNGRLVSEGKPYLLIGVGRWGTLDPWLGIPVRWDQISGAKVIVESGFKDFAVEPSQGSHFFQNLTAFMIGYFSVNPHTNQGFVDWEWLKLQPTIEEKLFTRHLQFDRPFIVKMNGHQHKGIILKPEK